jgi:hypothetical protein
MTSIIGYVDNTGQLAHYNLIAAIKTAAEDTGWWQTLRYDTSTENHELILKGQGYSGDREIYIGLRAYQNPDADYYNLLTAAFTGYVPENAFLAQPGVFSGVPAHNQRIDYWINLSPQRIAAALKVGTPVYESFYIGHMLPYARPDQYPYPIVCAGMLNAAAATRFSETTHSMPYRGNRVSLKLRNNAAFIQPECFPWTDNHINSSSYALRDTGGVYLLMPVVMHSAGMGLWGELEGIFQCSGFNAAVEDTFTIDGLDYVLIQDVWRTGHNDYYALRLD